MMVMTSIVLFNYNRFNETSLISAFAYDLSLTIRQAQVYGTAVKGAGGDEQITKDSVGSNFKNAYGVHFEKGATSFILFLDSGPNPNGVYDGIVTDPTLQAYNFQRGIKIANSASGGLCVTDSDGEHCDLDSLDVTFLRPNPEAIITAKRAGILFGPVLVRMASIELQSADSALTKRVVVESTGQISVK